MDTYDYIIGIDEVGRGSLAGPVTVAAVAVPMDFAIDPSPDIVGGGFSFRGASFPYVLKDSKQLSAKERDDWEGYIKSINIHYVVRNVHPEVIDEINITNAANLAAHRAMKRMIRKIGEENSLKIYLDGGLFIKNSRYQKRNFDNAETLIKADENVPAVALASIIAKVSRDRYMKKLGRRYPQYGFDMHKGYGTEDHREAISKHGFTPIHRLTFLSKYNTLPPITKQLNH